MLSFMKKLFSNVKPDKKSKEVAPAPLPCVIGEEHPNDKEFYFTGLSKREIDLLMQFFSDYAPDLKEEIELCLPENFNFNNGDIVSKLNEIEICFSCSEERLAELADREDWATGYCSGCLWGVYSDNEGRKNSPYHTEYVRLCSDKQNPKIVRYIGRTTADGRLNHGRCYVFEDGFDGKYVGFINNKGDYDVEEKEKFIDAEE